MALWAIRLRCAGCFSVTGNFPFRVCYVYIEPPAGAIGQSSSVMLAQKIHMQITAARVKSVSKRPPLMAPLLPVQMCT